MRRLVAGICAVAACLLAVPLASPASAEALTASRARAQVSFTGAPLVRVDRQTGDDRTTVDVSSIPAGARVFVDFGDADRNESFRCPRSSKSSCSRAFTHEYTQPGTYTVAVNQGARSLGTHVVTVADIPRAWVPAADFVQPAGWTQLTRGATFVPCQSVSWFFDHSGEPADRSGMVDDINAAFSLLAPETGLSFTPAADAGSADIVFNWGDTGGKSGLGGGSDGYAEVTFSPTDAWTANEWAGSAFVTKQWDDAQGHWSWTLPGRAWLATHEIMHGLGIGHVEDPTQMMNPQAGKVAAFGPGDLDALHTMYLSNPCPVIP